MNITAPCATAYTPPFALKHSTPSNPALPSYFRVHVRIVLRHPITRNHSRLLRRLLKRAKRFRGGFGNKGFLRTAEVLFCLLDREMFHPRPAGALPQPPVCPRPSPHPTTLTTPPHPDVAPGRSTQGCEVGRNRHEGVDPWRGSSRESSKIARRGRPEGPPEWGVPPVAFD